MSINEAYSNPFIEDGHVVHFKLAVDQVVIDRVVCPFHARSGGYCRRSRDFCVVQRFIGVYGTEICVGTVSLDDGPVEIAWVAVPGDSDLDNEVGSIWFIPVLDEEYQETKQSLGL